ncbi:hypothetical protein [Halomonas sp. C05BenzN]|uniref:hypothetical protein n=1 Tax=Halomonas sp. C05BenzN TaxID=3411041 RepID=UPI003B92D0EC
MYCGKRPAAPPSRPPGCCSSSTWATLEQSRAINATLAGKPFDFIIDTPYQWSTWAAPRDRDRALTGDDLLDFVNRELFPWPRPSAPKTTCRSTLRDRQ